MSVRRDPKRGTWSIAVDLPRHPDGKRNQRFQRGFATEKAAKLAEAKLLTDAAGGRATKPGKLTFAAYLTDRWVPALRGDPKRKPSTVAGYEQMAHHLAAPPLGTIRLADLAGDHFTALYGTLRAAGKAERTIRYVHVTAHLALKDAVRWRLVGFNPVEDADAPAQTPPRPKAWAPEQVGAFLTEALTDRWWPLWRLAATTGLRRGELAGLRWEDLNLDSGRLVVAENRVVVDHAVITGTPKGNRARPLELDVVTVEALRSWRRQQLEERFVMGADWPSTGLVFVWPDGSPLHPDVISRTYGRIVRRLGLPPMRMHNLRHAWATSALQAGVDIKIVSARLGHSSTRITHDIYTVAVPSMDAAAAELVAGLYDTGRSRTS